jgi:hypothetical protein
VFADKMLLADELLTDQLFCDLQRYTGMMGKGLGAP